VDEVIPLPQVVDRAVEWCRSLLGLPPQAMNATRSRARADLAGVFERDLDRELAEVTSAWWSEETQAVLRALAEKLKKKN
jgi:hypothetical protein